MHANVLVGSVAVQRRCVVEARKRSLNEGCPIHIMKGKPSTIVVNGDRSVLSDIDGDPIAAAREVLIEGVCHNLPNHVYQARSVSCVAHVHPGPSTHRFEV
jgi:hypothetical protein